MMKLEREIFLIIFFVFLMLMPWAIFSNTIAVPNAADLLNQKLSVLKTFSAAVTQQVLIKDKSHLSYYQPMAASTGHVWIQVPGKFRYEVDHPNAQIFVSDGVNLYEQETDLEQVIIQPLNTALSETPLFLLSGSLDLGVAFNVVQSFAGAASGQEIFVLTPKENNKNDGLISRMVLVFNKNKLYQIELDNPLGQKTRLIFSNIKQNQKLSEDFFKLNIPKGFDVLN